MTSTYDGSLWGPDVCRCGGHVDPHRHTEADPYGKSIYDEDDEPAAEHSSRLGAEPQEQP